MPVNKGQTAKAVGIGTAISLAATLVLLCVICGILMMTSSIPVGGLPYIAAGAAAIGVYIGAYIAAAIAGSGGLITGLLCSAAFCLVLLIFGLCSGSFDPGVMLLVRTGVCLAVGAVGGIRGVNRKEKLHIK